jgi:hypothetical protein
VFDIQYPTYKEIIESIEESAICRLFFPSILVNKPFHSFFREDPNASARIFLNKKGRLCYNDFQIYLTLEYLIMEIYHFNPQELSKRILEGFGKDSSFIYNNKRTNKSYKYKPTVISKKARNWEEHDIEFWNEYGIDVAWLSDPRVNVEPVSHYWIENNKGRFMFNADKYAYSYNYFEYDDRMLRKIYQPYNEKFKWSSNIVSGEGGVLQLWDTLPKQGDDILIISSSLKDSGAIYCNTFDIFKRGQGIYSIAPNSEADFLPPQIVPKLNERFRNIYVWFDQDNGGHIGARKYQLKYGYIPIFIPEWCNVKDPSDFRKMCGKNEFITLIKSLTNEE